MRSSSLAFAACCWLSPVAVCFAQTTDVGQEVQVNPIGPSGSYLLYPGGQYIREVPALLYPDEKSGPVHLHVPTRSAQTAHVSLPTRPVQTAHSSSVKPKPKVLAQSAIPKRSGVPSTGELKAAQASAPADNSGYASFLNGPDLNNLFGASAPKPQAQAAPPKAQAQASAPKPKPTMLARAEPAPAQSDNVGLVKRSVILFAKDAPDPARGALDSIKFLAGDLNTAMTAPSSRIELQAYGGTPGDKGSDARRLSLKRALAIRQILIDDGVSPDRIDVQAMGGTDDSGPADRVDVFVKA